MSHLIETLNQLGKRTLIMGVLNVTPDSFSDGGRFVERSRAVQRAEEMVQEGVDIIDIGGESTRPGSDPVSLQEELDRVLPVIEALAARVETPISIDTYKSAVAEAALKAGAAIINDISGGDFDPKMLPLAARAQAPVCLMHIQGTPRTMQQNPEYTDVAAEVRSHLEERAQRAVAAGLPPQSVWIDPGIGFGKNLDHNLALLRAIPALKSSGFPVLIGTSRKSFIGKLLGGLPPEERLEGTLATVALAISAGADILRVHDVKAAKRVAVVSDAWVRGLPPDSSL